MQPPPNKPTIPRGRFYERGTPEEEEVKHAESVARARERKKQKEEKETGGNKNDAR